MNSLRLVQAACCLGLSALCLWAQLGSLAALLVLAACAYVALSLPEGSGRHG